MWLVCEVIILYEHHYIIMYNYINIYIYWSYTEYIIIVVILSTHTTLTKG